MKVKQLKQNLKNQQHPSYEVTVTQITGNNESRDARWKPCLWAVNTAF